MTAARWGAIGAGAGLAGLAYYHAQAPTSQLYGPTISSVAAAEPMVALTYDDGPNPRFTEPLLELLDRHRARATFLLIGRWAERRPELVRAVAERGHALGNHSFSHPTMPLRSDRELRVELARCRDAVEGAGARFAAIDGRALMRPPYGRRRPGTLRTLHAAGYLPLLWSITCFDWRRTTTAAAIVRRAVRAHGGDIVLLHDGSDVAIDADRSKTIAATAEILERLGAAGYRFGTVPELVAAAASSDRGELAASSR